MGFSEGPIPQIYKKELEIEVIKGHHNPKNGNLRTKCLSYISFCEKERQLQIWMSLAATPKMLISSRKWSIAQRISLTMKTVTPPQSIQKHRERTMEMPERRKKELPSREPSVSIMKMYASP
jgi:hypothetical protein